MSEDLKILTKIVRLLESLGTKEEKVWILKYLLEKFGAVK